jgi:hypothetical protein
MSKYVFQKVAPPGQGLENLIKVSHLQHIFCLSCISGADKKDAGKTLREPKSVVLAPKMGFYYFAVF